MFGEKDYSYIQKFIDYLKQIIELIMKFFSMLGGSDETTTTTVA